MMTISKTGQALRREMRTGISIPQVDENGGNPGDRVCADVSAAPRRENNDDSGLAGLCRSRPRCLPVASEKVSKWASEKSEQVKRSGVRAGSFWLPFTFLSL